MGNADKPLVWDPDFAARLTGSMVLVGITDVEAPEDRHEQVFGIVEDVDPEQGVAIRLSGSKTGQLFWLPPDLRPYRAAPPGEYSPRSTGEIVVDPDFAAVLIMEFSNVMPAQRRVELQAEG